MKISLGKVCILVCLTVAASELLAMPVTRKKCIAFGWEHGFITPTQLLANADKFKGTAIDGIGIYLMATNRAGMAIGSRGFMSGPEWENETGTVPTRNPTRITRWGLSLREIFSQLFSYVFIFLLSHVMYGLV